MAYICTDRILETSTSTGTGNFTLAGAITGFAAFSSVSSSGDYFQYYIEAVDSSGVPSGEWETGYGKYVSANTLQRYAVVNSSNAGSLVNFSAGTKRVGLGLLGSASLQKPTTVLTNAGVKQIGNALSQTGPGALSTIALSPGWVYIHAFRPQSIEIATGIAVQVTTAAAVNCIIALYEIQDTFTLKKVAECASFSLSTTGVKTNSLLSDYLLTKNDYFIGISVDASGASTQSQAITIGAQQFQSGNNPQSFFARTWDGTMPATIDVTSPGGYRGLPNRVWLIGA